MLDKARKIILNEAEAIASLADHLDDNFIKAVDLVDRTSGRVIFTGIGKSAPHLKR